MNDTLATYALKNGGKIRPIIVHLPREKFYRDVTISPTNPSIYNDNGKLILNLRTTNYILYHAETKLFQHQWGPLSYIHPEHDAHLRTENYYCEINSDTLDVEKCTWIDTKTFDKDPLWDFVGLEDARIVRWDGKLYISGVRRDTTTNGVGRMELSEIDVRHAAVKEINRVRIPPPSGEDAYCEKNWMPFVDLPFHYVKWSNPTEIVKFDPKTSKSETVSLSNHVWFDRDFRGGSQVISFDDGYLALTHEVWLFNNNLGRKDGRYYHRFLYWNKNFRLEKISHEFSILGANIEFSAGMCKQNNDILITFGFQDNGAYILKLNENLVRNLLTEELKQS
jgi:hypothetical protein